METLSIDLKRIEELKELIDEDDPDFLLDLFRNYLENADGSLKQLNQALASDDRVTVVKTAHTLKGSSLNMGVLKMGEICQQLQAQGESQSSNELKQLLMKLEGELELVKVDLENHI